MIKRIIIMMLMASWTVSGAINQADLLYYNIGASGSAMGTASGSLDNDISAAINNPAALASIQQLKFATMYGDIAGGSKYFYLASGIPTKRGVLGASFRYFGASSISNLKQSWGGNVLWAKNFTDNLYIGLGFKFFEMYYLDKQNPQFGVDIGTIYTKKLDVNLKKKTHFNSWSIGAALLNLGNQLVSTNKIKVSIPFQIKAGPSFNLTVLPNYELTFALDLVYANFERLKVNVGLENRILDKLNVNIGYLFNSQLNSFSFGLGYKLKLKNSEGKISAMFLPYQDGNFGMFAGVDWTFGSIDTTPPKAEFKFDEDKGSDTIYISPNYDGKQDTVTIDMGIKDNKDLRLWNVNIVNEKGDTVKKFSSPDIRTLKGKLTVQKVLTRMFEKQKELPVPQKILWDGKSDSGMVVPDGNYKIYIDAMDENKNSVQTPPKTIVIDTVAPKAELKSDLTLFSPNGVKSNLTISQNVVKKANWVGEIRDSSGKPVRKWTWNDAVPDPKIVWNGKDSNGNPCPNGVYSYDLTAQDKAGNTVEKKIMNLSLVTDRQSVSVDADVDIFSPNGDGVFDTVTFTPQLTSTAQLSNWEIRITDDKNNPVKTFGGQQKPQSKIVWNGTDDNGRILKDGNYFYKIKAEYFNGDRPASFIKGLTIDTTPPQSELGLSSSVISPDGGGKNEALIFTVKVKATAEIKDWKLEIKDEQNRPAKVFSGLGNPAAEIVWFGLKDDGKLVKGGEIYTASLTASDIVGNKSVTEPKQIKIDAKPPDIAMTVKYRIFSPDGDGEADTQEFKFERYDSKTLKRWTLQISLYDHETKAETPFTTLSGTNLPPLIIWDGKSDNNVLAQGGQVFKAQFSAQDILENSMTLKDQFICDSTPPNVEMKLNPQLFSPDGDGQNDIEYISLIQKDRKKIKDWKVEIYPLRDDKRESLFKSFAGTNMLPSTPIVWNGLGDNGDLVESAQDYEVDLTVSDVLQNITSLKNILNVDILVIKMPYGLKIKISNIGFEYNKAELKGDKTFDILNKVGKILAKYRTYKVEIDGHTDNIGGVDYNLKLSESRAKSVMDYFVTRGLSSDQFRISGKGLSMPVADNNTDEGRAKNRRVEFLLFKEGWPQEPVQTQTTNR